MNNNIITLECVKCTQTQAGAFRLTLQSPIEESAPVIPGLPAGKPRGGKKYAYISMTPIAVGTKLPVDFNYVEVRTEEWKVDDPDSDNFGETVKINWINPKQNSDD